MPFDLLDEVEQKLGLTVTPLSFPIGMGYDFKGFTIFGKRISTYSVVIAVKILKT